MKFTPSLTATDPLANAAQAVLEAKFGPQTPANKLAQVKSFVKQYQVSLKHAIADGKDAETIAFWKKRLAAATKELAALTTKNEEYIDEAAQAVLSMDDLAEAKQSFTDLKKPVQDSLLKIFQMYDNTSLTRDQKDGLAAVFKYGLEFSDFANAQSKLSGR